MGIILSAMSCAQSILLPNGSWGSAQALEIHSPNYPLRSPRCLEQPLCKGWSGFVRVSAWYDQGSPATHCSITLTPWGHHVSSPKSVISKCLFFFSLPLQGHLFSSPITFIQSWALDSLPIDQTVSSKAQTRPKKWLFNVSLSFSSDLASLLRKPNYWSTKPSLSTI